MTEVILDERGKGCPMPVISLGKAAADLAAGSVIVVLADDPAAAQDIPAWCRLRGAQLVGIRTAPDGIGDEFTIRLGPLT